MRLETNRLVIRPWTDRDCAPFASINADPEVRRYYYPALLDQAQSDAVIAQCMDHLDRQGFAFLALERRDDGALIGGAGLSITDDVPGGPAIEIGWILGRPFWRQGYASEASRAWFDWGWAHGMTEIVGYTSAINTPSRRAMESLGMRRTPADDFADVTVPEGNPLRPHVLYRITNPRRR
ncbi:GNAT family N-acetyltransferase [Devosia sp. FKR38]|uniref:GNAT family N-acetyltransferase n=1 Tax=Devosia sp. FKR38 TaxID=2562312 RepID=UPI0010C01D4F|nr:GNAT family N-acetyltransferase [Devosia sp. FKR38]